MATALDRQTFFARLRLSPFLEHLTQCQVSGIESILNACPADTPTHNLAYGFGT